jgi:DNA-binding MarR family transcriptional regulator
VTAGAISQRVARAEREGLVTRSPSDAGRRAVAVTLTAAGHELVERAVRELLTHEEELVGGLTAEDRQMLAGLLARLDPGVGRQAGSVV